MKVNFLKKGHRSQCFDFNFTHCLGHIKLLKINNLQHNGHSGQLTSYNYYYYI